MEKKNTYYWGFDLGTDSLGWAVTDSQYRILRAKGKDLWGVRLFERAKTSEERRTYRVSRRRRQREVARIGVLRELFANEIEKVDPGFYARLDDSKFHMEERRADNKQKYALFIDSNFTDKEYFKKYPTIFHLRKELLESDQPHDVRLLYLALGNMFKHRGHFLNTSLGLNDQLENVKEAYYVLYDIANEFEMEFPENVEYKKLEDILGGNDSRKRKEELVAEMLNITKKQTAEYQLIHLMCGLKGKLTDIFRNKEFDEEQKSFSVSFRDSDYEEKAVMLQEILDEDELKLIQTVKQIHDCGMLSAIMKGYPYISMARVASYEKHHEDLQLLKTILKKYDRTAYHKMFREMGKKSYSAYVGSVNCNVIYRRGEKERRQEDLYKGVRDVLKNLPQDDPEIAYILKGIENESFLPKQLTSSNGVIPNQVHAKEMKAILERAETYLPFLAEKDGNGLSVSEKILQLFSFKIPYYVGPLGQKYKDKKGYNVWAERKAYERIYPWNFSEMIDEKKSAEKFIQRMVRHCTYLAGEMVLPKQSLLYEKFRVLNELNNLQINGERISVDLKQDIYHTLFENGKKVSLKNLKDYLLLNGIVNQCDIDTAISGIDNGFRNSLSSIGKFFGVLGEEVHRDENRQMIEKIIFWGTVYGEDKKFLKEKIEEAYGKRLSESQKKRIMGFKFSGWGRLSKAFLTMEGASKEDGEIKGLIQSMWDTNCNLGELLGDNFTYKESLELLVETVEKPLTDWKIEDLDDLYLSAPVKRMVWQTMHVAKELQQVLGEAPKKIFVEMAREDGEKGKRSISRKKKLLTLYEALGKEGKEWKNELEKTPEEHFRNKKLYLYYLQRGRCMYTEEIIDLNQLMNDNLYDIDHIYPRHYVKDDNLYNNLVLVKKEENAQKSDELLKKEIRDKRRSFWKGLREKNFLTEEKYNRLTRKTPFTDKEKAGFISRQLVETRQGTKVITQIFKQAFPESEIIYSKAGLVSDFRNKYDLYKVRCVNNYHHAHDAYLNIVVGNVYYVKFTKNPLNFIREAEKNPNDPLYHYNMDKVFEWDVVRNGECAWSAAKKEDAGTIKTVKKYLRKNSPLMTKMTHEEHGSLTQKTTIWGANKAKPESYIPIKMSDPRLTDVTKYGGQTAVAVAGYTLLEYKVAGKTIRCLDALPVYLGRLDTLSKKEILEYFEKTLTFENGKKEITDLRLCKKMIPKDSRVRYNGFYYYLAGKTGKSIALLSAVCVYLLPGDMYYIKKIEKAFTSGYYNEKDKNGKIIISRERNEKLYKVFLYKYRDTIFSRKAGAMGNILVSGEEKFSKLHIEEQCKILLQILLNFQGGREVDLQLIGGSKRSGNVTIDKKISNAKEFVLIYQSPAGIFSREINLLTI